jgi:branched chain amino acid efflux pump
MTSKATASGIRDMLPLLLAVAPLGLIVGVEAAAAHLPAGAGLATGVTIYGASAQLAAIDLLDQGLGLGVVLVTVVVINIRLALYSATMAPHWATAGPRWRFAASYLLVDPSYAVGLDGYRRYASRAEAHTHYLAGAVTLWLGWQALIAVGMTLGPRVPPGLHLELAAPLCLTAIVAQRVDGRDSLRAAGVAAAVAVAGHGLPLAMGLTLAIVAGAAAGGLTRTKVPA